MSTHFKNITLVGASGYLGAKTLDALIKQDKHHITVITRPASTAEYPGSVTVKKTGYDDSSLLENALVNQDVLVIMLGFTGLGQQELIIDAAAKAGVKWIIPSWYGIALDTPGLLDASPLARNMLAVQGKILSSGLSFTTFATNSWLDYCVEKGLHHLNWREKRVTLYPDSIAFPTTTTTQVGRGIAALLALPIEVIEKRFKNTGVSITSFQLSQPQMFEALVRASGTSQSDWAIEYSTAEDLLREGRQRVEAGEFMGDIDIIYALTYQHGDYSDKLDNELLGLPVEDLDEVLRASLEVSTLAT